MVRGHTKKKKKKKWPGVVGAKLSENKSPTIASSNASAKVTKF
jgi:hypothetical protein